MSYASDLTGKRFGRLLVLSRNYDKQKEFFDAGKGYKAFWNCMCDCGNYTIVSSSSLRNKTNPTLSCGCYKKEIIHKQKNTKENQWVIDGETTIGITSSGDRFYIDTEDYTKVKNYCWRINKRGYVVANSRDGSNREIRLHRFVMNVTDKKIIVDHKNWDKTNNRKNNIRIATKSQNNINIKRKSNNTTGYTGVTFNKRIGKYCARISKNGVRTFLGYFDDINNAIEARHNAEINIHGEWSGEINRKDYIKYKQRR